jgi:hypothetical protein
MQFRPFVVDYELCRLMDGGRSVLMGGGARRQNASFPRAVNPNLSKHTCIVSFSYLLVGRQNYLDKQTMHVIYHWHSDSCII